MPSLVTRTARIEHQARRLLALPLGAWAVRAGGGQGHAGYLLWGDPDLGVQRGPWRHLEQIGAAHRLEGPDDIRHGDQHNRPDLLTSYSCRSAHAMGRRRHAGI